MKRITIAPLIILLAILLFATVASAATHSIQYIATVDDWPDIGQQTWLYHTKSNGAPAISHVSLSTTCPCEYVAHAGTWSGSPGAPVLDAGGGGAVIEQRSGYCEVKWDEGMDESESRDVYLTVNGIFSQQPTTFTIKAGQEIVEIVLPGPQCTATAVSLLSMTSQQRDSAVLIAIALALFVAAVAIVAVYAVRRRTS